MGSDLSKSRNMAIRQNHLQRMCLKGDLENMKLILRNGASVQSKDKFGETALHYASSQGNPEVLRLLIRCGANVNQRNGDLRTALHVASSFGHSENVKLLLQQGSTPAAQDKDGDTSLHDAIFYRKKTLQNWGNGPSEGTPGQSAKRALKEKVAQFKVIVCDLIEKLTVADLQELKNGNGFNVFQWAAFHDNIVVLRKLVSKSKDFVEKKKSSDGLNALHLCSSNGHYKAVKLLLVKGEADPDATTNYGVTPLHLAVNGAHCRVIELLSNHGADANAVNCYGHSALHCAFRLWLQERDIEDLEEDSPIRYWSSQLEIAGQSKKLFLAIACYLVFHCRADPTLKDKFGDSPVAIFVSGLHKSGLNPVERKNIYEFVLNLFKDNKGYILSKSLSSMKNLDETVTYNEEPRVLTSTRSMPSLVMKRKSLIEMRDRLGSEIQEEEEEEERVEIVPDHRANNRSGDERHPNGTERGATSTSFCIVCRERKASVKTKPCGHQVMCHECCLNVNNCHLCSQPITRRLILDPEGRVVGKIKLPSTERQAQAGPKLVDPVYESETLKVGDFKKKRAVPRVLDRSQSSDQTFYTCGHIMVCPYCVEDQQDLANGKTVASRGHRDHTCSFRA